MSMVQQAIEVGAPLHTVYEQIASFENYPRFMTGVEQVTPIGHDQTHWVMDVEGVERASRYAPTQLARPLGLLARLGVDDTVTTPAVLDVLAGACRSTGTAVEVSEAWRSPSARIVALLRAAHVAMVPASDARYAAEVGRWQYVRRV